VVFMAGIDNTGSRYMMFPSIPCSGLFEAVVPCAVGYSLGGRVYTQATNNGANGGGIIICEVT
jgi:hypothetical protein